VRLDWLDARLECVEWWGAGTGDSARGRETVTALHARLLQAGTLPARAVPGAGPPPLDALEPGVEPVEPHRLGRVDQDLGDERLPGVDQARQSCADARRDREESHRARA